MRARILDPQVKVYSSMDEYSISIATLQEGSEIEFGGAKKKAGKLWVPIVLSTGQQAFIPGEARIFVIREGSLMQNDIDLHSEPSAGSLIKQQLKRNTKLSILQVIKNDEGQDWVRVRDTTGNEGYIPGDTRFRLVPQKTKAMGRKNMINGGMWLVAGVIMLISEYSSSQSSGFALFGYAAIVFGIVMLVSGVLQVVKAPT